MNFVLFLLSQFIFSVQQPHLIPQPLKVEVISESDEDGWTITNKMQIGYDPTIPEAELLLSYVTKSFEVPTGYSFTTVSNYVSKGLYFGLSDSTEENDYQLEMTDELVVITGKNRTSLFYGFQTLLQLLPSAIYSNKTVTSSIKAQNPNFEWKAQPLIKVSDSPRFSYRGLMVDSCRHFFPVDVIKTMIDGMSHYKLNTLHFHLTDDQGWRIELKKFPNLTKYGSTRDSSPKMWDRNHQDDVVYGPYFYTEEDLRDIIKYAKERCISVVPEIEMPGHGISCLAGYPQYSCTGGSFKPYCKWGVTDDIFCAGNDETITFLESILDEVLSIFTENLYVHLGGDEAPKTRWNSCPKCQQRIKDEGLKDSTQLQQWFTKHFASYLESKGRRLVGWDDIIEGGLELPKSGVVMSYRANGGGKKAADLGYNVIMSPGDHGCYFDYYQFRGKDKYEYLSNLGTLKMMYYFDPSQPVAEDKRYLVLGAQGNLWSEYIWERSDLLYKAFPRILALAESSWCPADNKDWERFLRDLDQSHYQKILDMGIENAAPISLGDSAKWEKGDFVEEKWLSTSFSVSGSFNQKGTYDIAFIHVNGLSKIKIRNVKLLINNAVVGSDDHEGTAGNPGTNNIYTMTISQAPSETDKIEVFAEIEAVDGIDSSGYVHVFAHDEKD
ncbi:hypothetical protein M9Y10_042793 [Tritrichomonas musculus]|uniref:beta-N-acetylhexosaminidase n=1 Tax=Tritrichomonas musculus TaxID=1915356 RepID=A0ABR2JXU9_9EUKA